MYVFAIVVVLYTRLTFYGQLDSDFILKLNLSLSLSLDKNDTNQRLMLKIIYKTNPR